MKNKIKELASMVDLMVIIGSFTSANSKRLTSLSSDINKNTYQVTGPEDLKIKWFEQIKSVGISAGASTPDYLIDQVKNEIETIGKQL